METKTIIDTVAITSLVVCSMPCLLNLLVFIAWTFNTRQKLIVNGWFLFWITGIVWPIVYFTIS